MILSLKTLLSFIKDKTLRDHQLQLFAQLPFQRQRFLGFEIDTDKGDQRIGHHLPFWLQRNDRSIHHFCYSVVDLTGHGEHIPSTAGRR